MTAIRAETRAGIAGLRVESHPAIRSRTGWILSALLAVPGLIVAGIKQIP